MGRGLAVVLGSAHSSVATALHRRQCWVLAKSENNVRSALVGVLQLETRIRVHNSHLVADALHYELPQLPPSLLSSAPCRLPLRLARPFLVVALALERALALEPPPPLPQRFSVAL